MKFGLNTNSLRKHFSIPEIASAARQMGVDGIEWGLPELAQAKEAAREMLKASRNEGLDAFSFINASAMWKIDEIRQWSEIAAENGVHILRVAHPWYAWNYEESRHQPDRFDELVRRAHDAFESLTELGRSYEVRYVLETHAGSCFASPMSVLALKEFDPAYCGFIYDPANTYLEGFMRLRGAVEMLGPYLAYLHVKNLAWVEKDGAWSFEKRPLNRGMVDYHELAFALKLAKFDGYCSFEELYSEPAGFVEEVRSGLAYFKQCLAEAPAAASAPYITFNR